jgi:hypothetical protein
MPNSDPKLLVESESSRELYVTISGTPETLRSLAASLSSAIDTLPSPLTSRQPIYPKGFDVADASGSKRETYLSFHAEPTLDYLPARQRRRTFRDWIAILVLIAAVIFAVIGFMTALHWIV